MSVKLYRNTINLYTLCMKRDREIQKELRVLGLTQKEEAVFLCVRDGLSTPLLIARHTKIMRSTIYDILKDLKIRGLIESYIVAGKKGWRATSTEIVSTLFHNAKKVISNCEIEKEEIKNDTGGVVVYRGKESVHKKIFSIFSSRQNERFSGLTSYDGVTSGWQKIMSEDEINMTNEIIKHNKLISDAVFPEQWLENNFRASGGEWAQAYEGRTASTVYIPEKYFNFSSQIFAFRDALYLFSLEDEMIIEIKHNQIQKMIFSMYEFIKDHGEKVDTNRILRDLLAKK